MVGNEIKPCSIIFVKGHDWLALSLKTKKKRDLRGNMTREKP